ncbi:MAG TPA: ATP-binding protein [Negativicutes bacterium]|nr:ATP-binding protein [Negativicutes bacterium]
MNYQWKNLDSLVVYRGILQDTLIQTLRSNVSDAEKVAVLIRKAEELSLEGNIVSELLIHLISEDENPFSTMAEKSGGKVGSSLLRAALHDIVLLKQFFKSNTAPDSTEDLLSAYHPTRHKERPYLKQIRNALLGEESVHTPEAIASVLTGHYVRHGYGDMARYTMFRWDTDSGLIPVRHPDRIQMDDLVGYERQKAVLTQNTEAFVTGKPANNVLLVGSRGTGKSSSVKALLNQYADQGLRLVEITKHDLRNLSLIMQALRERGKKFILFMDDLSFEEFEVEYRHLKSMMEGGVETKPDNVLIYATSNRRHLIKETWSDRTGANAEDIHSWDTINEKISLSDRFGITLTFAPPNQEEYLRIVESMASKRNLCLPVAELRAEAIKWETAHSGRSGRIAQQFIAHIEGRDIA